jgi:hypothetical protein
MKPSFLITIIFLILVSNAYPQDICANIKIETPAVTKPANASIVSLTCSTLVLAWQGTANQTYVAQAAWFNTAINKMDTAISTNMNCDNSFNCTAIIPVVAGTSISWSVQASATIDTRAFYSYPFRGDQDYIIPACRVLKPVKNERPAITVTPDISNKVKIYPNPFQTSLNIEFSGKSSVLKIITVFDVGGRMISTQKSTQNLTQLNLKHLTNGSYVIRIQDAEGKLLYNGTVVKE